MFVVTRRSDCNFFFFCSLFITPDDDFSLIRSFAFYIDAFIYNADVTFSLNTSGFAPDHSAIFSPFFHSMNKGTTRTPHSFINALDSVSVRPKIFTNAALSPNSSDNPTKVG